MYLIIFSTFRSKIDTKKKGKTHTFECAGNAVYQQVEGDYYYYHYYYYLSEPPQRRFTVSDIPGIPVYASLLSEAIYSLRYTLSLRYTRERRGVHLNFLDLLKNGRGLVSNSIAAKITVTQLGIKMKSKLASHLFVIFNFKFE